LPAQAVAAVQMLLGTEREACVHLQILDSQIQNVVASLEINETICGEVQRTPSGDFKLGKRVIPAVLLDAEQQATLTQFLGGRACFEPTLQENRFHGEILNLAPGSNAQPTTGRPSLPATTPVPMPTSSTDPATATSVTPTATPSTAATPTSGTAIVVPSAST